MPLPAWERHFFVPDILPLFLLRVGQPANGFAPAAVLPSSIAGKTVQSPTALLVL
jgi:hypothetical protein